MSQPQLYYDLVLEDENTAKEACFRLPSELPWPSPLTTTLDLAIISGDQPSVIGYSHEYGALYMYLALKGNRTILVDNLEECRKELFALGWEEVDGFRELIRNSA